MSTLDELLDRLEEVAAEVDGLDEAARRPLLELLDGLAGLHQLALARLAEAVGPAVVEEVARAEPAVAWLVEAYGVGVDERTAAEAALEEVRPYVHSHGGRLEVLDAAAGVVRVRLSGTCSGCTASAVTLAEGVERALREALPGFVRLDVEEDMAPPHPPPGETLLQIRPRPG